MVKSALGLGVYYYYSSFSPLLLVFLSPRAFLLYFDDDDDDDGNNGMRVSLKEDHKVEVMITKLGLEKKR